MFFKRYKLNYTMFILKLIKKTKKLVSIYNNYIFYKYNFYNINTIITTYLIKNKKIKQSIDLLQ